MTMRNRSTASSQTGEVANAAKLATHAERPAVGRTRAVKKLSGGMQTDDPGQPLAQDAARRLPGTATQLKPKRFQENIIFSLITCTRSPHPYNLASATRRGVGCLFHR